MPTTMFQTRPLKIASLMGLPGRGVPRRLTPRRLRVYPLEHLAHLAAKAPGFAGEEGNPPGQQILQGGGRLVAAQLPEGAHRAHALAGAIAAGGLPDQRHQVGEQLLDAQRAHGGDGEIGDATVRS